jgi:hypothetical protein
MRADVDRSCGTTCTTSSPRVAFSLDNADARQPGRSPSQAIPEGASRDPETTSHERFSFFPQGIKHALGYLLRLYARHRSVAVLARHTHPAPEILADEEIGLAFIARDAR